MARLLSLLLLVASPLVLSAGLVLLGLFLHGVGRAFGSHRPPTAIVVAMLVLALLHAGYYLGPLLWLSGRTTLGLWLMTPIAIVAGLVGVALFVRILPAASESTSNVRWFCWMLGAELLVAMAYALPILVMARTAAR
jgi:hypothetical protein